MATNLSVAQLIEKNRLASDDVFLFLLEITIPENPPYLPAPVIIQVCRNTEDVTWRGVTWFAFPFDLEEIGETSKDEVTQFSIKVSNVSRIMDYYMERGRGGIGSPITLYIISANTVNEPEPFAEIKSSVVGSSADNTWANFTLGAENRFLRRCPRNRILKRTCRYQFKDARCGYTGTEFTICNKSLTDCRLRSNSRRFGNCAGVGSEAIYV